MSHLNFRILAFSTNFCPIKTDLSGNTVWPQASGFQKLAKMRNFLTIFFFFSSLDSNHFKNRIHPTFLRKCSHKKVAPPIFDPSQPLSKSHAQKNKIAKEIFLYWVLKWLYFPLILQWPIYLLSKKNEGLQQKIEWPIMKAVMEKSYWTCHILLSHTNVCLIAWVI